MALRSGWNVGPIGVWRAIVLPCEEPSGWRAGDIAFHGKFSQFIVSLFWTTVNIRKPQPAMRWRELAEKATKKSKTPKN